MPEVIFRFDKQNVGECQDLYRGPQKQEYYQGEYSIEPARSVAVHADKKSVGPSSVIRLVSRSYLRFRRTWRHIRADGIDLTVLWFVKRGSIRISGGRTGEGLARAGDFLISRSASPFFMECRTDERGVHEVTHVTVPTHIAREFIPDGVQTGFVIPGPDRRVAIACRILDELLAGEAEISAVSDRSLLKASFSLLADALAASVDNVRLRQSIAERRTDEVLRFIDINLCNPNLNTRMVCAGCGISPRYLSTLLQMRGTSFSELVWGQRMAKAKEWLSSSVASEVPVSEVAFSLGFKSASHFSRRFKRVYRFNPSDCRAC